MGQGRDAPALCRNLNGGRLTRRLSFPLLTSPGRGSLVSSFVRAGLCLGCVGGAVRLLRVCGRALALALAAWPALSPPPWALSRRRARALLRACLWLLGRGSSGAPSAPLAHLVAVCAGASGVPSSPRRAFLSSPASAGWRGAGGLASVAGAVAWRAFSGPPCGACPPWNLPWGTRTPPPRLFSVVVRLVRGGQIGPFCAWSSRLFGVPSRFPFP